MIHHVYLIGGIPVQFKKQVHGMETEQEYRLTNNKKPVKITELQTTYA